MAEKGREKEQRKESRVPARWDPFADLDAIFEGWRPFGMRRFFEDRPTGFAPAIDVHENDNQYVVSAEVPGVAKNDLTVEVDEGMLTIRGEKRSEREEKKERRRWIERSYGSFTRSMRLPADAVGEKIDATFKDGVLTITIPKAEQRKPKTVAVKG